MKGFLNEAFGLNVININTWFQKVIIRIPPCLVDFYVPQHEHALSWSVQPYLSLQMAFMYQLWESTG